MLSPEDLRDASEYCDLDPEIIQEICMKYNITSEQSFCNCYEGRWTKEGLIDIEQQFINDHVADKYDFKDVFDEDGYLVIPAKDAPDEYC